MSTNHSDSINKLLTRVERQMLVGAYRSRYKRLSPYYEKPYPSDRDGFCLKCDAWGGAWAMECDMCFECAAETEYEFRFRDPCVDGMVAQMAQNLHQLFQQSENLLLADFGVEHWEREICYECTPMIVGSRSTENCLIEITARCKHGNSTFRVSPTMIVRVRPLRGSDAVWSCLADQLVGP